MQGRPQKCGANRWGSAAPRLFYVTVFLLSFIFFRAVALLFEYLKHTTPLYTCTVDAGTLCCGSNVGSIIPNNTDVRGAVIILLLLLSRMALCTDVSEAKSQPGIFLQISIW